MKFDVTVERFQGFRIELKEEAFTEAFMEEFRRNFYQFHTLEEHAKHLGQLASRDLVDGFVEGYGEISAFADIIEGHSDTEVKAERIES